MFDLNQKIVPKTDFLINFPSFSFISIASPPMQGTVLSPMMQNEMMSQVPHTQTPLLTTHSTATIIPPPGIAANRAQTNPHMSAAFHPFVHPEMLMKNPFLPYELANMRGIPTGQQFQPLPADTMPLTNLNASRVSPTSSRPSSSSPPLSAHSDAMKLNNSIDTVDSDVDDDETIDVEESTFEPIVRPSPLARSIVGMADSTTINGKGGASIRTRCELKAPSSRKSVHETAPRARTPETRLKTPITTQKAVWRPY